jgi:hypothetical protein
MTPRWLDLLGFAAALAGFGGLLYEPRSGRSGG